MRLPPNFHSVEHGGRHAPTLAAYGTGPGAVPGFSLATRIRNAFSCACLQAQRVSAASADPSSGRCISGLALRRLPLKRGRAFFYDYAAATFVMTLLRFAQRSVGQHRGEEIHTAEAGYSLLTHLLPVSPAFTEQLLTPAPDWLCRRRMHAESFPLTWAGGCSCAPPRTSSSPITRCGTAGRSAARPSMTKSGRRPSPPTSTTTRSSSQSPSRAKARLSGSMARARFPTSPNLAAVAGGADAIPFNQERTP